MNIIEQLLELLPKLSEEGIDIGVEYHRGMWIDNRDEITFGGDYEDLVNGDGGTYSVEVVNRDLQQYKGYFITTVGGGCVEQWTMIFDEDKEVFDE